MLFSLLLGCATDKIVCRHKALATAIFYAEQGKEVRIVSYVTNEYNSKHAEPQVKEGDNWKYIKMTCNKNEISSNPEYSIKGDVQYYGLHEYLVHIGIKKSW